MDRKLIQVTLAFVVIAGTVSAQSQDAAENAVHKVGIVSDHGPQVFQCEPGSIPETSLLDKMESEVKKFFDVEEQEEPDRCKYWSREYAVPQDENTTEYRIGVVKYENRSEEALLVAERDGSGVSYADVLADGESVGATGADGMFELDLVNVSRVEVKTSDGKLGLETR